MFDPGNIIRLQLLILFAFTICHHAQSSILEWCNADKKNPLSFPWYSTGLQTLFCKDFSNDVFSFLSTLVAQVMSADANAMPDERKWSSVNLCVIKIIFKVWSWHYKLSRSLLVSAAGEQFSTVMYSKLFRRSDQTHNGHPFSIHIAMVLFFHWKRTYADTQSTAHLSSWQKFRKVKKMSFANTFYSTASILIRIKVGFVWAGIGGGSSHSTRCPYNGIKPVSGGMAITAYDGQPVA